MKKYRIALLTLCLILAISVSIAENFKSISTPVPIIFDPDTLKNEEFYSYDPFDKTWNYGRDYYRKIDGYKYFIGIGIDGSDSFCMPIHLTAYIEEETTKLNYQVTSFSILINENVYRFSKLLYDEYAECSFAFLGNNARDFLQEIAEADTITVRFVWGKRHTDFEVRKDVYTTSLKRIAKKLIEINALNSYNTTLEYLVTQYGQFEKY